MAVTIRDIAERLNLSKSTVSHALNGDSTHVSAELRARVRAVAKEMGFRPNQVARSLATGRTNTIGLVPHSLESHALLSSFARRALSGIFAAAEKERLHVLLPTGYDPSEPEATRDRLFDARVDGLVLLASNDETLLRDLIQRKLPMAVVARHLDSLGPSFNADNAGGSAAAIDHFVSLGHERIAVITWASQPDVRERADSAKARLAHHGLVLPDGYLVQEPLTQEGGRSAAQRLLSLETPPTAVFCSNDGVAYGFIHVARQMGFRVPEDISVIGFDDDEISETFYPPLTTVRQPVSEMATAAFDAVVQQIAGKHVEGRIFPAELIIRQSTAPRR